MATAPRGSVVLFLKTPTNKWKPENITNNSFNNVIAEWRRIYARNKTNNIVKNFTENYYNWLGGHKSRRIQKRTLNSKLRNELNKEGLTKNQVAQIIQRYEKLYSKLPPKPPKFQSTRLGKYTFKKKNNESRRNELQRKKANLERQRNELENQISKIREELRSLMTN
jgi:hypothetical protein